MIRAIRFSLMLAALPLAISAPVQGQVCHPVRHHHHRVVHVHQAVVHHLAGLGVVVDETKLISFPKPVKTVSLGNSTIADVSMIDSQHAFLLGKTFGVTNMIALAPDGQEVSNQQVTVYNNGAAVTVNRGAEQYNYMCTLAHCESSPRPGDPNTYVQNTESAANSHESTSTNAGTATQAQQASN